MTWQLLTAISVVFLSFSIILQRILVHKDKVDPVAYTILFQGLVGGLLLVAALFRGFSLPNIGAVIVPAAASLFLFAAGHIFYAKTLQKVEASIFSVLFATSSIWMMVLGMVLFHEQLTVLQVIGSVLIFSSVILVVKDFGNFSFSKGTGLGLLTGLLFGLALTSYSYVGRHTDTLSWGAVSFMGIAIVALLFDTSALKKMKPLLNVGTFSRLIFLGIFYAIGSIALLYAYKIGDFSVVSPLRQSGIMVTVLMALLFLPSERNRIGRKIVAAFVASVGVVLIVI